ncbi:Uncharacterized protein QTN25_005068 [Entamoeba marina]
MEHISVTCKNKILEPFYLAICVLYFKSQTTFRNFRLVSSNCLEGIRCIRINPELEFPDYNFYFQFFPRINTLRGDIIQIQKILKKNQLQQITFIEATKLICLSEVDDILLRKIRVAHITSSDLPQLRKCDVIKKVIVRCVNNFTSHIRYLNCPQCAQFSFMKCCVAYAKLIIKYHEQYPQTIIKLFDLNQHQDLPRYKSDNLKYFDSNMYEISLKNTEDVDFGEFFNIFSPESNKEEGSPSITQSNKGGDIDVIESSEKLMKMQQEAINERLLLKHKNMCEKMLVLAKNSYERYNENYTVFEHFFNEIIATETTQLLRKYNVFDKPLISTLLLGVTTMDIRILNNQLQFFNLSMFYTLQHLVVDIKQTVDTNIVLPDLLSFSLFVQTDGLITFLNLPQITSLKKLKLRCNTKSVELPQTLFDNNADVDIVVYSLTPVELIGPNILSFASLNLVGNFTCESIALDLLTEYQLIDIPLLQTVVINCYGIPYSNVKNKIRDACASIVNESNNIQKVFVDCNGVKTIFYDAEKDFWI